MSFERPEGLWLLALAVPILAFHFYRGKVRRLPVPTLLFWEQVLVEEERQSALKRLRHYASLLLNLLALTVLTSAVSEPRVRGLTPRPRKVALVVDTDPRMLARGALDRACEGAAAWLDACDEAALYDGEGLREPLTRDLDRVRRGLGSIRIRPRGDAREIERMLRRNRPDLEVVLLSAPAGPPIPNRGWVGGTWVSAPEDRFPTIRLEASRFGGEPREERVVVRWNGEPLTERTFRLETDAVLNVPLDPSKHPGRRIESGGVAEVAFADADAFSLDDAAFFVVPATAPLPVIVFHPDRPNPLLMGGLRALAAKGWVGECVAVAIDRFEQARPAIGEGTGVIFDRCRPPEPVPAGAVLQFGAVDGVAIDRPVLSEWDGRGPLLQGIDLTDLAVKRARVLSQGDSLIRSTAGAIAVSERRGGFASVTFGFSLEESDFSLGAAFPLFLRNWIEWVRRGAMRSLPAQVEFGTAIGGTVPDRPGVFAISAEGREEVVAVNGFDRARSDLSGLSSVEPQPAPAPRPWYRKIPYAWAAVAIVLALLFVEWFLFHRGWI